MKRKVSPKREYLAPFILIKKKLKRKKRRKETNINISLIREKLWRIKVQESDDLAQ